MISVYTVLKMDSNKEYYDSDNLGLSLISMASCDFFVAFALKHLKSAMRGTARLGMPARMKMITLIHGGYDFSSRVGNFSCKQC